MAGTGLAGGLAEGLQNGIGLASTLQERQFDQSMRQKQSDLQAQQAGLQQQEFGMRKSEFENNQNKTALDTTTQQLNDLGRQIASTKDPDQLNALDQQRVTLLANKNKYMTALGGAQSPDAKTFSDQTKQTVSDLASGKVGYTDLDPADLAGVIKAATGHDASDFVDTKSAPAPIAAPLAKAKGGIQNIPQDNGKQLLDGINDLSSHELQNLIGHHADDGSTIVDAKFAPPVPHPDSSAHYTKAIQLTVKDAQGRTGTRIVPLMNDRSQMLLHPNDSGDATVSNFSMQDAMDHIHAMDTLYQAVQSHPELRDKIIKAHLNGDEDTARQQYDMLNSIGYVPPKKDYILGQDGKLQAAPVDAGTITVQPKGFDPALEAFRLAEASRANSGGTPSLQPVQGSDGKMYSYNNKTGQFTEAGGLAPGVKVNKIGAGGPANQMSDDAIETAAQRYRIDGTLPALGMGGAATKVAILNRSAEQAKAEGKDAEASALQQLAGKTKESALSQLEKTATAQGANEKAANKYLDLAVQYSDKVDRTNSPLINKLKQSWSTDVVQDPDLKALKNSVQTFINEYAKVTTGQTTGQPVTDAANAATQKLLAASDSTAAFKVAAGVMRREMAAKVSSFKDQRAETMASLSGKDASGDGGSSPSPGAGTAQPPANPSAAPALPAGWSIKKVP